MAIKFGEHSLIDENGKVYLISYRELLQECLKHPFNTPSISTIVIETIQKMTGERIASKKYNDKPLYCWLEKRIQADERYQEIKKAKGEKDAKKRQQIIENKKNVAYFRNEEFLEAYCRKVCRKFYRTTRKRR